MALSDVLSGLLGRAATGDRKATIKLKSGLIVWARVVPEGRQLVLTREGIQDPWGMKREAYTCGKHAGWAKFELTEWTTPKGARCLTVTEVLPGCGAAPEVSRSAAPVATIYPEGTCGSCDHATPSADPDLLDCTLGWEHHDGLYSEHTKRLAVMGHGDALLPASSPTCRCGAVIGGHRAWVQRRGVAAA